MPSGGLSRWFKENWVDLSRPKKGGGFEPCGRPDASEGKYPKCVPASRAAKMTEAEIKSAVQRKRRAESTETREGQKPINVKTKVEKKNIPADPELYAKVKAAAKAKFDVYPSAYANGWLVQEYKRRGGKYKTVSKEELDKGDYPGHPFRGNQHTGGIPDPNSKSGRRRAKLPEEMGVTTAKGLPRIMHAIKSYGGMTWNPKRGELRASGVAVSPEKITELKIPVDKIEKEGPPKLKGWIKLHAERLSMPGAHIGAWISEGEVWFDVSVVVKSVSEAADIGRAGDQVGIYDMTTDTEYLRHMSPTTKTYKYLPSDLVNSGKDLDRLVDEIGKAANPVLLCPAEMLTDENIAAFCKRLAMGVSKDSPTPNTVHVDSVMGSKKKRKKKKVGLSALKYEEVGKGDYPGHPFRGNQWTGGIYFAPDKGAGYGGVPKTPKSAKKGFRPATAADLKRLHAKHKIKVPPQWTNVYVSQNLDKGTDGLLVRGIDGKGRVQSLYSAEHTANQAAKKWKRVKELAKEMPKLDAALGRDAKTNDTAAAVLIMRELGMRPGSTADTGAAKQAYGATTLEARHVFLSPNTKTVRFTFTGKGGKKISVSTRNPKVWDAVSRRMKNREGRDRLFDTNPSECGDYIKRATGKGFMSKDLRTHKAMVVAADMVSKIKRMPKTERDFRKIQLTVGDAVAKQLGNTRTMALNSYIPPMIFDALRVNL